MKKLVPAFCLMIVACSGRSNDAADFEPVGTMLQKGDQKACAHPAVKKRILADMNSGMDDPTPESVVSFGVSGVTQEDVNEAVKSFPEPTLQDAQALGSDKSTNILNCAVHVEFGGDAPSMTAEYDLQPSADSAGFQITYPKALISAKDLRSTYVGMKAAHIAAMRNSGLNREPR